MRLKSFSALLGQLRGRPERPAHTDTSLAFKDEARDARPRLMASFLGLESEETARLAPGVVARARARGREPILVVDQPIFDALRPLGAVIELAPSPTVLRETDAERYRAYMEDRLESIRESWLVTEELTLGVAPEDLPAFEPVTRG